MDYNLNQEVEAYTASGWQKGKIIGLGPSPKGVAYKIEKQNGHIGVYDEKDLRPAQPESAEGAVLDDCPIRKRMQQGQQEPKFHYNQIVQFELDDVPRCGVVLDVELQSDGIYYSIGDNNGNVFICIEDHIREIAAMLPGEYLADTDTVVPDPIRPNHYTRFAIDPIEYCLKNGIGFCAGNVIKYVSRFDMKGGLEDLDKAEEYLRRMRKDYAEKQAKAAQKN